MCRLIKYYVFATIVVFAVNLSRYIRCLYYQTTYNLNFKNNTPLKNYNIKQPVFYLFKKAKVCTVTAVDISLIANELYENEINHAFEHSKGYFRYWVFHSPMWLMSVIENLKIFAPARKVKNKIISVLIALIESIFLYFLGLYFDTTGIGSKILAFLLSLPTALSEHLERFFR